MKILNISSITKIQNNNSKSPTKKQQEISSNSTSTFVPHAAFYLPFEGGNSLDLSKTYQKFENSEYPNIEIKDEIKTILEAGNEEEKTLYDVHFNKYRGILDCFTLDELKEKYPEFQNVNSVWEIEARENSFIGKYQYDKSDIFSSDEDLTLQLIKLYWGQGFSLTDLSKYIAQNSSEGKELNLYYALTKKLNIPLMNSHYASVLKLSNKDYNENFCEQMSIKRKEAAEAREQKAQGEAVIIPRGELSAAHKKHISESLKKYYKEHPEALTAMSERQKKFYEENPRYKEELSEIMDFAWNKTREGKTVKRHLSKFLRKYYKKIEVEKLTSAIDLNQDEQNALQAFWDKNTWAKEKISIARQKAEQRIKELSEIQTEKEEEPSESKIIEFNIYPSAVQKDIVEWARKRGYGDVSNLRIGKGFLFESTLDEQEYNIDYAKSIINKYERAKGQEFIDMVTTAQHAVLVSLKNDLEYRKNLPLSLMTDNFKYEMLKYCFDAACKEHPLFVSIGNNELMAAPMSQGTISAMHSNFVNQACTLGAYDVIDYLNDKIDKTYNNFINKNKNFRI